MSESSVAEQSHHIVTAQSHSAQSQHSHIEVSHKSAVSQRCHRSVTQNLYMVREHDRPPHRDFSWNPVSPCQVQVPGVPGTLQVDSRSDLAGVPCQIASLAKNCKIPGIQVKSRYCAWTAPGLLVE